MASGAFLRLAAAKTTMSSPGVNRLMGVRWLMSVLYPRQFPESLRDTTREFYKLFYQVDLTEPQLDSLVALATASKPER
jgi:iron complex transport system substrate-binding protein